MLAFLVDQKLNELKNKGLYTTSTYLLK